MASEENQDVAYSRELEVLAQYRDLLKRKDISPSESLQALDSLIAQYERLTDDSRLLTSVGDRLQRKLKSANLMLREQAEEIKRINASIQEKNVELQLTVDELTRARASRRASALVLVGAIALFILSEILEEVADNFLTMNYGGNAALVTSWIFKTMLVLLFKPTESYLERRILKTSKKQTQEEIDAKREAIISTQEQVEVLDPSELAKKKRAEARHKAREEAMTRESIREKVREKSPATASE